MTITHTNNDAPFAVAQAVAIEEHGDNDIPTVHLDAAPQNAPTEAMAVVGYPVATAQVIHENNHQESSQRDLELGTIMTSTRLPPLNNTNNNDGYSQRAEFISITFMKPTMSTFIGLHLSKHPNGSDVQIAFWEPSSPVLGGTGESPFQPGDVLYSINRKPCQNMTPQQVAQRLRSCQGPVTLVAHCLGGRPDWVESTVVRTTTRNANNHPWGVSLRKRAGAVEVSEVKHNVGLFHYSLLNIGDKIVAINGVECGGDGWSASAVAELLHQGSNRATVLAQTRADTGMVVAEGSTTTRAPISPTVRVVPLASTPAVSNGHSGRNQCGVCLASVCCAVMMILVLTTISNASLQAADEYSYWSNNNNNDNYWSSPTPSPWANDYMDYIHSTQEYYTPTPSPTLDDMDSYFSDQADYLDYMLETGHTEFVDFDTWREHRRNSMAPSPSPTPDYPRLTFGPSRSPVVAANDDLLSTPTPAPSNDTLT